ncbi:MAG: CMP/dCMP kinase [Solirubrobacterales bacterium]|jgi:cytidylate kinase|nr:CMP/dCMP kinase [Solirubrobacterales bacterium]
MVIAIDGPAGAGKSTIARAVADALGFTYLDSGAMYRCAGLAALRAGIPATQAEALGELASRIEVVLDRERVLLDGEDVTAVIRAPEVSAVASLVAAHAEVRLAMVAKQRALLAAGRYVAEGRDIGTVVAPDAPLKLFLTASESERARRRAAQTGESAEEVILAQRHRDGRDRDREHGALRPAEDSVELDTTGLDAGQVADRVVELARERGIG